MLTVDSLRRMKLLGNNRWSGYSGGERMFMGTHTGAGAQGCKSLGAA